MTFRRMRDFHADFALHGGDDVFDALAASRQRSLRLFDPYERTQQDIGLKVYHALGNHDCFGVYPQSGFAPSDPLYGKAPSAAESSPPARKPTGSTALILTTPERS